MSIFKDMLDAREAAELIGCSIQFIRIRLRDGRLPALKLGSRYRIKKQDVLNLLEKTKPHNVTNGSLE